MQASLVELPTQSGFPKVSVAAREADERRRVYQPKGFEKNGIRLDAGFEERIVWDNNPNMWPSGGKSRIQSISSSEARLTLGPRDWHLSAEGLVRGVKNLSKGKASYVDGGLILSLDGSAWRQAHLSVRASARRTYQVPGDPSLLGATVCPIPVDTYIAFAKKLVRRTVWFMAAGGQIQKDDYGPGCFADGRSFPQNDRDRFELQSFLRLGASPTSQLDVFWGSNQRVSLHHHIQPYSTQLGFKEDRHLIGVTFDINDRLVGEISHGRAQIHWFSPFIRPTNIPVTDASVSWSMTPLTTVSGSYKQSVTEGSQLGYVGALSRSVDLGVHHEMLRNLEFGIKVSRGRWMWYPTFLQDDFEKIREDKKTTFEISAKLSLGSHVYVGLDAHREWAHSSELHDTYNRTRLSARFGVRL